MSYFHASICLPNKRRTPPRYSRLLAAANANAEKPSMVAIAAPCGPEPGPFCAAATANSLLRPICLFALLLAIIVLDIALLAAAIQLVSLAFLCWPIGLS